MSQEIKRYGKAFQSMELPDLMDTQRRFYAEFLQMDTPPRERKNDGLEAVFREVFPIESYDGSVSLEYLEYQIDEPPHSPDECRALEITYAGPLKIKVRLTGKVPAEEWVYLGGIPLMIGGGEFVVNGAERVIVTQLQRSPGCDFSSETHSSGKQLHSCRIIPERGSWIQVEVTSKDQLNIRIDRSGKLSATTFLRALAVQVDEKTNQPINYEAGRSSAGEGRRFEQWTPLLDSDSDILRAFHPVVDFPLTPAAPDELDRLEREKRPLPICASKVIDYANCQVLLPACSHLTRAALERHIEDGAKSGERKTVLSHLLEAGLSSLEIIGRIGENGAIEGLDDDLIVNTLAEERDRVEEWGYGVIRDIIRASEAYKRLKGLLAGEGDPRTVAKSVRDALISARDGRDSKPRSIGALFIEEVETDRAILDEIETNVASGLAFDLTILEELSEGGDARKTEDNLVNRTAWRTAWSGGIDRIQYIWALLEIYKRLRPGTPASRDKAQELFYERFFDEKRYNFGEIGRFRLNRKFGITGDSRMTLSGKDFLNICNYLLKLRADEGNVDDIDHLENRRIRTIKDLVMAELRSAMIKLRRSTREQMVIKSAGNEQAILDDVFGYEVVNPGDTDLGKGDILVEAGHKAAIKTHGLNAFEDRRRKLKLLAAAKPDPQFRIPVGKILTEAEVFALRKENTKAEFLELPAKNWLVVDPQETELMEGDIISDDDCQAALLKYGQGGFAALNLDLKKGDGVDGGLYRTYQEKYGPIPGMVLQNLIRPHQLINIATFTSAIDYFFARGELSQVVDQSNPLSQLVHERRLSALGPGGLNRKRAGFEVRDVHTSHYGRICPVETPEGTNIGLIVSLANYAAVNDLGFLITPYFRIRGGAVTNEVVWLRADEEADHYIAQADIAVDRNDGRILVERPMCRHNEDFMQCNREQLTLIDVSPKQLVGISASLIPFLEHDDANRALMGSNMQRQAVPLVRPDIPLVGTGMERDVVRHSGMVARAREDGEVLYADSLRIVVSSRELTSGRRVYRLHKNKGLNDGTTLNQTPLVRAGDRVRKGDPLTEGAATKGGELALGKNTMVAFLSFEGCNFEDAILCSEKLIRDDAFTSVHIEEFVAKVRETKVGSEEITRDIPGVSEAALANLDETGLIRIGTKVEPGDILVGKIAPKAKAEFSSEEKLLRAIFGRAGEDVKNDSLTVPPGTEGYVINVKRFSRRGLGAMSADSDPEAGLDRALEALGEMGGAVEPTFPAAALGEESIGPRSRRGENRLSQELVVKVAIKKLETVTRDKIIDEINLKFRRLNEVLGGPPINRKTGKVLKIPRQADFERMLELQEQCQFGDLDAPADLRERIKSICLEHDRRIRFLKARCEVEVGRLRRGDDLGSGVLELVKVYVAVKRKLSLGDKMAGRHGNKGVVARILPEEDMPFLEDGTPVEMVLNPLGVPSRMNVGQILETHLGWSGQKSGFRAITPVFNGATEEDIQRALEEAGLPRDGKAILYDGRTGEPFHEPVTVGNMYMIKLHHLVAEKIHARATGPYSLITQQPLGGKARNGGQRFGEMEVWALEAYGAANILQELLTYKSDDVDGRTKIYEAMVKGESTVEPGMPVSFDVLCNEIRGIGLNIKLERQPVG